MVLEATRILEQIPVERKESGLKPILDSGLVQLGVRAVGDIIGVPVVIRPWWGSRRQLYDRRHIKCRQMVSGIGNSPGERWCFHCNEWVPAADIKTIRLNPGKWVCAAGWNNQLKWPTVVGDHVVMWEGECRERYRAAQMKRYGSATHVHQQTLEVLDFTITAMLVRISVVNRYLHFLIGRDDGHPFVQVVTRKLTTVAAAFDYLVPVPVDKAQRLGFHCPRQGDWWFVPREFWGSGRIVACENQPAPWPVSERPRQRYWEFNHPYTQAPLRTTRHVAELFIAHLPFDLVKGTVTAPDHPPVKLETWHCAMQVRHPPAFNPDSRGSGDGAVD